MTNDERNPKPECRRVLWCAMAHSSFGFRYSFGFRHSSFGFEHCGSWRAPTLFSTRIGTMNRSRRGDAGAVLLMAISAATSHWQLQGSWKRIKRIARLRYSRAWYWRFDWEGKSVRGCGCVRKMLRALASTYIDEKVSNIVLPIEVAKRMHLRRGGFNVT